MLGEHLQTSAVLHLSLVVRSPALKGLTHEGRDSMGHEAVLRISSSVLSGWSWMFLITQVDPSADGEGLSCAGQSCAQWLRGLCS